MYSYWPLQGSLKANFLLLRASQRGRRVYVERYKGAACCMYKAKRAMMALEMELEEQDGLGLAH